VDLVLVGDRVRPQPELGRRVREELGVAGAELAERRRLRLRELEPVALLVVAVRLEVLDRPTLGRYTEGSLYA
jgi:hypothetical protein